MRALLLIALAALLPACDLAPPQASVGAAELHRPLVGLLELSTHNSPPPDADTPEAQQRRAELNELMDKFLARGPEIFQAEETDKHLNGIEEMASNTGRSFALIDLYREVYDKLGPSHYVAPRLAWAYLNLGQVDLARKVVDASLKVRPDDARLYFVHGYLLGREREMNNDVLKEVHAAWTRALSLDPKLERLFGVRADVVRDRVAQMERLLGTLPPSAPASGPPPPPQAPVHNP